MTKKKSTKKSTKKTEPRAYGTRVESIFVPVHCPKCGSGKREKFKGTATRIETTGVSSITGEQYNVVVKRRTACLECKQAITATSFEWDSDVEKKNRAAHEKRRRFEKKRLRGDQEAQAEYLARQAAKKKKREELRIRRVNGEPEPLTTQEQADTVRRQAIKDRRSKKGRSSTKSE